MPGTNNKECYWENIITIYAHLNRLRKMMLSKNDGRAYLF